MTDDALVVAHRYAVGTARGNRTPPDLRVSFTVVSGPGAGPRIAGLQYSLIRRAPG